MASAPWNDLLGFDAQLDETERQVQDSIRSFCDEQLMPGITEAVLNLLISRASGPSL